MLVYHSNLKNKEFYNEKEANSNHGGYEVIKIVEESKSKNIYFFTWCY